VINCPASLAFMRLALFALLAACDAPGELAQVDDDDESSGQYEAVDDGTESPPEPKPDGAPDESVEDRASTSDPAGEPFSEPNDAESTTDEQHAVCGCKTRCSSNPDLGWTGWYDLPPKKTYAACRSAAKIFCKKIYNKKYSYALC
jgi:hypothetical protein